MVVPGGSTTVFGAGGGGLLLLKLRQPPIASGIRRTSRRMRHSLQPAAGALNTRRTPAATFPSLREWPSWTGRAALPTVTNSYGGG
jgi:hypothetical protein